MFQQKQQQQKVFGATESQQNSGVESRKDELVGTSVCKTDRAMSSLYIDVNSKPLPMQRRQNGVLAEKFYLGDDESDEDENSDYGFGSSPDSWNYNLRGSSSTVIGREASKEELMIKDEHATCFVMSSEDEDSNHEDALDYGVQEMQNKLSRTGFNGYMQDEDSGFDGSAPNSATDSDEANNAENMEQLADLVPLHAVKIGGNKSERYHHNARKSKKLRFYDFYKLVDDHLGSGAYACVRTAISLTTGEEFAVKLVDKRQPGHTRSRIFREVEIFKLCHNHPNIVQLIEWFEDDTYFYMVFEKMRGGPLLNHIQRKVCFTEQEASLVTRDIAMALKFLHDRGVAHRDVKPENILCTDPFRVSPVKLCDLDLASKPTSPRNKKKYCAGEHQFSFNNTTPSSNGFYLVNNDVTTPPNAGGVAPNGASPFNLSLPRNLPTVHSEPDLVSPVGSAEFMAPEVVDAFVGDSLKYDKRCDMWSLGVIVYIMLCGYPPFYGECDRENCGWDQGEACSDCQDSLFHRIQIGEFDFPHDEWANISAEAKDLISHLLVRNVRERYTADDVLKHSWVACGAPKTPLQTPSNLFRNDSARDMHQMNQVFQVYMHVNKPSF